MRVPPMVPNPELTGRDMCCERGAHELAARIRAVWAKAGHAAETHVVRIPNTTMFTVVMPHITKGPPPRATEA